MTPDSEHVKRVMQRILRDQAVWSHNNPVSQYIFDNNLLRITYWPAFCITLTDAGRDYMREA